MGGGDRKDVIMRVGRWIVVLAMLAMAPVDALADEEADKIANTCSQDSDCPAGMQCIQTPCAQPACEPGKECPPVDCASNGYCEEPWSPELWGPECKTDADCPFAFTCTTQEQPCATTAVACPPCEPGKPCPECKQPDPVPCTPGTQQVCVFKPKDCTADTDCEAGFECHENKVCSGSGGTACACAGCACPDCPPGETCPPCDCPPPEECKCDNEPADPPAEETCTVEGAWCLPKEVKCTADADCPKDWSCKDIPAGAICASGGTATDCACPPCPAGETCPACDCPEPAPAPEPCEEKTEKYCLPAGWDQVAEVYASGGESGGVALGLPKDAAAHDDASATPENGNPKPPATPGPTTPTSTNPSSSSSSDCMASNQAAEPIALGLLFALGFLGLALRRRYSGN